MNVIIKSVYIFVVFSILFLSSCSSSKYVNKTSDDYAVIGFKSEDVRNNFTQYKSGLKITYDFWGETLLIILENVSDSVLYINLDKSIIKSDNKSLSYNNMIAGSFSELPLMPDSIIELNNFFIITEKDYPKIKEQIKSLDQFVNKQKFFKIPIIHIENNVEFSIKQYNKRFNKNIKANFYSENIRLVSPDTLNSIEQTDNMLYAKTFVPIKDLTYTESTNNNDFIYYIADIMVDLSFLLVEFLK